jgi:hypothetical protein
LPFGGVESHQYCVGCGCIITDYELCQLGLTVADRLDMFIILETLAFRKGYHPIEAGTLAEYKLRKNRRRYK